MLVEEERALFERDAATRNFKLAQKTADNLVFNIAEGLRDVQGMSAPTVRMILETARATFEQLAASAPDDLALQRSRSAMLVAFGQTYQTLGDLAEALIRNARAESCCNIGMLSQEIVNLEWRNLVTAT